MSRFTHEGGCRETLEGGRLPLTGDPDRVGDDGVSKLRY